MHQDRVCLRSAVRVTGCDFIPTHSLFLFIAVDVKLAAVIPPWQSSDSVTGCHGVIVQTQFVWGITLTDFLVEVWQGYLMLAKTT